jgi:hypothetical protein
MTVYYVITRTDGDGGHGPFGKSHSAKLGPYRTSAEAHQAAAHQRADRRTTARVVRAGS